MSWWHISCSNIVKEEVILIRILDDPTGHFVYDLDIVLHLEEASHANIIIFLWYLLHCKASYCKLVIVEG